MGTFDVNKFLVETAPSVIVRTACACGKSVCEEQVHNVLHGEYWEHTRINRYIYGLSKTLRFAVEHMGWHLDLNHVKDIGTVMSAHSSGRPLLPMDLTEEYRISEEISLLHDIEDKMTKAVVSGAFVMGLNMLGAYSAEVGLMVANEILLGSLIGFISPSPDDYVDFYWSIVNKEQNPGKLIEMMNKSIIRLM